MAVGKKRHIPAFTTRRKSDVIGNKPSGIPRSKKLKLTKSEMWAMYGYNRPSVPRYEGLKGIYWYALSIYVRTRDLKLWNRCISCNKWVNSIEELQAGHFIAAGTGGFKLLFDPRNVNGECGYCNGCDQNHLIGYERSLDERYGPGTAQALKDEYYQGRKMGFTPHKTWNDKEYDIKIRELQSATIML